MLARALWGFVEPSAEERSHARHRHTLIRRSGARVHQPKIVDLFAGPGGLDVAARWLGVSTVGLEWDANACATRTANALGTEQGDVRDFEPEDFPSATVLAGGPPCQTYTVAGGGTGRRALDEVLRFVESMAQGKDVRGDLARVVDERTGLVLEPLRWALRALESGRGYETIVLEQVPAVLPVWEAFGRVLASRGYSVAHGLLHAEEFGVPQTRRRAVLIARRHVGGRPIVTCLPGTTHRPFRRGVARHEGSRQKRPWVSMEKALGKKEPFFVVSNYGTGGDPKARGVRQSNEPAFTVTGKISRNRVRLLDGRVTRFSLEEAGQLQTFPEKYTWSGRDVAQQIGNAIPPVLGVHVLAAALGLGSAAREAALDRAAGQGAAYLEEEWVKPKPDAADALFAVATAESVR